MYDYNAQAVIKTIPVGKNPLAAAISMSGDVLYVTNNGSSSLSVIDLGSMNVTESVTLPASPEGVEVGADGRAVIATSGNGASNLNNTLLIFDSETAARAAGPGSTVSTAAVDAEQHSGATGPAGHDL